MRFVKNILSVLKKLRNQLRSYLNQARIDKKNLQCIQILLLNSKKPIKLELGGVLKREGWISIDLRKTADICLDLSRPMPFTDNCISEIYSSHLLEHFYYPKPMTDFLSECYRILKPGGIISVAVPNARIYLDAYFKSEEFDDKKYCLYDTGLSYKSKIDFVNHIAYMGGHHCHMFDEENLFIVLIDARFINVSLRNFDSSLDDEERRYNSIYAKGEK